jgi:nucleoside-diphosphate-sugar epimerase
MTRQCVLLTGATGFIGSRILASMVEAGDNVVALIRPGSNVHRLAALQGRFSVLNGDLVQCGEMVARIHALRPTLCVHSAWYAEPGRYLTSNENKRLTEGSVELARALVATGCKRFVGIGTCLEYDTDVGVLSETTPVNPLTPYAQSKLLTYQRVSTLGRMEGMEVAWTRLFFQHGPQEDARRLVPQVIKSLLSGERVPLTPGDQVRDFLHVDDVARAVASVAHSPVEGVVNIGSGIPVTVRQLVTKVAQQLNATALLSFGELPYRDGDPMYICADNTRLRQDVGWRPTFDLETGLRNTVDWWRQEHVAPAKTAPPPGGS